MTCAAHRGGKPCVDDATARVYWPGQTIAMCAEHAANAGHIAFAMGFELTIEPLPPPEPESHGERRTS